MSWLPVAFLTGKDGMSLLPVEHDSISLKRPNSERRAEDRVDIMISEQELDGKDMSTKVLVFRERGETDEWSTTTCSAW